MAGSLVHTERDLLKACRTGDIETVTRYLDQGIDVNTELPGAWPGGSALHVASGHGQERIVRLLVQRGADINQRDVLGQTAFHEACEGSRNIETVETLISLGADVNAENSAGNTPLHTAAYWGKSEKVQCLVKHGADVNKTNKTGRTVLHRACEGGSNIETVETLISHGADVNAEDEGGDTPLYKAAYSGKSDIVQCLVKHGADVNKTNKTGETVLHAACEGGSNIETVETLIPHGADVNAEDEDGDTPLYKAAYTGKSDIVQCLVKHGADVNKTNKTGQTVLHAACGGYSNIETVETLISHGANVNAEDSDGDTPLHTAAYWGKSEKVQCLVKHGADCDAAGTYINLLDSDNHSPLYLACARGYYEEQICKTLIRLGADLIQTLHQAARDGNTQVIQRLCELGADVNARDIDGKTVLHAASEAGKDSSILKLFQKGSSAEIMDNLGQTALHKACISGRISTITILLQNTADMDKQDNTGCTALHLTAKHGHFSAFKFLLERGSDISLMTHTRETVLHFICSNSGDNTSILRYTAYLMSNPFQETHQLLSLTSMAFAAGNHGIVEYLLNTEDAAGNSPLHKAVENGNIELLTLIMRKSEAVTALMENQNHQFYTPFQLACKRGNFQIIQAFIIKGVNFSEELYNGITPFHLLCEKGCPDAIKLALRHGAVINQEDDQERTPLFYACKESNLDGIETLLTNGANANHVDATGESVMMKGLHDRQFQVLNLLISNKEVNPDATDSTGSTLLHKACTKGLATIADRLVRSGCDINQSNNFDETALSLAMENKHSQIIMMLLCNGCCFTDAFPDTISDNEKNTLLYWAGNKGYEVFNKRCENHMKYEVKLYAETFMANHPRLMHSDHGIKYVLDTLASCSKTLLPQVFAVRELFTAGQFPTLKVLVRETMRNIWQKNDTSVLSLVKFYVEQEGNTIWNVAIRGRPRQFNTVFNPASYLFLYDEAIAGLPNYRDDIVDHFKFPIVYSNTSRKREAECPISARPLKKMKKFGRHKKAMMKCYKSKKKRAWDRKENLSLPDATTSNDISALHKAVEYDIISHSPSWNLHQLKSVCFKKGFDPKSADSLNTEVMNLQRLIHVPTCVKQLESITSCLCTYFDLLSDEGHSWSAQQCGSVSNNNKVGEFDEIDYSIQLIGDYINIAVTHLNRGIFTVKLCQENVHDLQLNMRDYIYEGLKHYFKDISQLEDFHGEEAGVYIRSLHTHSRGPGVCLCLAVVCDKLHTHELSVDVTPVICWEGGKLGDVWNIPDHMNKAPFSAIKDTLSDLPVYLIPSTSSLVKLEGGKVVSDWKVTYNNTKAHIFSCLDNISPNIRISFHLIKYLREFLPRKLTFTEENDGGSWNDGSLISSYVLYNIQLQEVLHHPTSADWTDELLVLRLSDMLKSLTRWSYIDFYKDRREESFSLTGLPKPHQEQFRNMMKEQITDMIDVMDKLNSDYNLQIHIDTDHDCDGKVCVLITGESGISYHVMTEERLRFETADVREQLGLGERDYIYYYKSPTTPGHLPHYKFYTNCKKILSTKFASPETMDYE